jgi:ABC-type glycerol-3-phosphate transport system substrate-binding protein
VLSATAWNNAPHLNAARVFANWIASKEGLTLFGSLEGSVPVRTDIEPTWVPADEIPQPDVKESHSPRGYRRLAQPDRVEVTSEQAPAALTSGCRLDR